MSLSLLSPFRSTPSNVKSGSAERNHAISPRSCRSRRPLQARQRPHAGVVAELFAAVPGGVAAQFDAARRAADPLGHAGAGAARSGQPARSAAGIRAGLAARFPRDALRKGVLAACWPDRPRTLVARARAAARVRSASTGAARQPPALHGLARCRHGARPRPPIGARPIHRRPDRAGARRRDRSDPRPRRGDPSD